MTITVIDEQADLNTGSQALHEIADTITGSTFLAIALTSTTLGGIKAGGMQSITVSDVVPTNGTDFDIETHLTAIALAGTNSEVINNGRIKSTAAAAILFSGGGTSIVTNAANKTIQGTRAIEIASTSTGFTAAKLDLQNAGTITASGEAIMGGGGADQIRNSGTLTTTSTAVGAVLMDLGGGNDFYEGMLGTATGMIKLGAGDDKAFGGAGDETFQGGAGQNTIDGGGGIDTVDYSDATVGVAVDLRLTGLQGTAHSSDQLENIENITGSNQNDTLVGSSGNNVLRGGNGNDTLEGGSGDDVLDGGSGNNTVRFSGSTIVTLDLSLSAPQNTGYGSDTLIGFRNVESGSGADKIKGSAEDNRLSGNSGADTIEGMDGHDQLIGGNGNDSLEGGVGNDTLEGGNDNDTLVGGVGNDTLQGGTGRNTAVFSGNKANYSIVTNQDGTITVTDNAGQDGTDTLKDVRILKFADQAIALTNGAASDISPSISPINFSESKAVGSQVTTLFSSDPDGDTLTFSLVTNAGGLFRLDGSKLILAGALDYETATKHTITVKVSDGFGGEFSKELTINVTNDMTETKPLVKRGTNASEQVVGENGNDQLHGLSGNDQVFGQGGNDRLWGDKGNDTLIGGAGNDVFVFDVRPNVKSNLDYVYDFNVKDDTIHLSKKIFSGLAKKGTLSKNAFVIGDHFKDADDRILYHKKGGALFYDPDGTGDAKAIQFATIGKNLKITHKDFYVI
ncbi:calcium-binding protein [Microvirga subterranea]|uniref:Ca2+-binding RTX toxin-like protein n=1 Tax=Microvirga subterranea TaxID=186651 RepID=A0A370HUV3_9HYPH|nr:calcium-binding protein [Microvirga subterranea]RDI62283.1 Ca2+-binding RTX toxin-like protein [Microvirga subterranea]